MNTLVLVSFPRLGRIELSPERLARVHWARVPFVVLIREYAMVDSVRGVQVFGLEKEGKLVNHSYSGRIIDGGFGLKQRPHNMTMQFGFCHLGTDFLALCSQAQLRQPSLCT